MLRLGLRDLELLRALYRLQLVRTGAFSSWFSTPRNGRRRLAKLREHGLVAAHQRCLPGAGRTAMPAYWHLAEAGLKEVLSCFPGEPLVPNHVSRAKTASLRFFEHRDGLADLYMALLGGGLPDQRRARAASFEWRGENTVNLATTRRGKRQVVLPDATVSAPHVRVFVEFDRSTESRARCVDSVRRYADALASGVVEQLFGDVRPCYVLYLTKSTARAKGLAEALRGVQTGALQVATLRVDGGTDWLAQSLFGDSGLASPRVLEGDARVLAHALRRLCRVYPRDTHANAAPADGALAEAEQLLAQYQ